MPLFVLIVVFLSGQAALAAEQSSPAAPDWWARGGAIAAFLVSVLTLIFARADKRRERKAADQANKPTCELELNPDDNERWDYTAELGNPSAVPIQLTSFATSRGFRINGSPVYIGPPPQPSANDRTIDALSILRIRGTITREDKSRETVTISFDFKTLGPKQKTERLDVVRRL